MLLGSLRGVLAGVRPPPLPPLSAAPAAPTAVSNHYDMSHRRASHAGQADEAKYETDTTVIWYGKRG